MSQTIRFGASIPIIRLEDIYRKKFYDSAADIRYRPVEENSLRFDIRVEVPLLIANDKKFNDRISRVLNRAMQEAVYECGKIAAEMESQTTTVP